MFALARASVSASMKYLSFKSGIRDRIMFVKLISLMIESDLLLLGCCTKFSYTLIKLFSHLAKITLHPTNPLYPIPFFPTELTNWAINEVNFRKLNWRQIFFCQYNHVYPISIIINLLNLDCQVKFFGIATFPCSI